MFYAPGGSTVVVVALRVVVIIGGVVVLSMVAVSSVVVVIAILSVNNFKFQSTYLAQFACPSHCKILLLFLYQHNGSAAL